MAEWLRASVATLQAGGALLVEDGNHGENRPRREELVSDGTAFVRATDMRNGRVLFSSASHINGSALSRIRKGVGEPGDVLLSHKGTVGKVAWVGEECPAFVCSPQTTFYRVKDASRIDRRYLYFYLQSPEFQGQLNSRMDETDMAPYVSLSEQRRLRIVLPPLAEQHAIAAVLGALDNKIEANQNLCSIVGELARAEVVAGQALAEQVVPLGNLVRRVTDIVRPDELDAGVVYVGLEHIPRGSLFLTEWESADGLASAKVRFQAGDILFGKLRPYFKKVVIAPSAGVCSTDVLVLRSRQPEQSALALTVCSSDEVINYASAGSQGTRMPRVSWDYLSAWQCPMPSQDATRTIQHRVGPMLQQAVHLTYESILLGQLRDALLPKLLSGELRVRDAESLVEDAV